LIRPGGRGGRLTRRGRGLLPVRVPYQAGRPRRSRAASAPEDFANLLAGPDFFCPTPPHRVRGSQHL